MILAFAFAALLHGADTIYFGGTVLTMDAAGRTAQAVAVTNGKIEGVGTDAEIEKLAGPKTKRVDLAGRTLLPGFYAAHDHFPHSGYVGRYHVDLNSPPIGMMKSMDDVVAALKKKASSTPRGQWIMGRGYDDTLLKDKRHPTRADLDQVSTEHPIFITHISGHLGVANSRALGVAGITRETPQPSNGVIRKDKSGEPNGVIEETLALISEHVPEFTLEEKMQAIRRADAEYLSKGVTTAVIAGTTRQAVVDLKTAAMRGFVHLRFDVMLAAASAPATFAETSGYASPNGQIRVVGVKMLQDGSIQGYTGYLGAPYFRPPEGKQDYRGYPSRSRAELVDLVKKFHRGGYQIAIHGNGDAAIDDILQAYAEAQNDTPRQGTRHRIEHCQMPREDQLDRMKLLGVSPSFFEAHVYYWGDRHRDIFVGPARAARISPLASALQRGIPFTLHNDTPVTPVDPLLLVWAAVNRETQNGQILGKDQRIGVMQALRAVTSVAAWQNFDEASRGSIEAGKFADFVILDKNPLKVPPAEIRGISVIATVIGGNTLYNFSDR